MKPVLLSLQAFGPYLDREEIDFRELDGRLTFLIAGNTGAGKSSILDAICFALYGDAAGEERSSELMRNKSAPNDLETHVSFRFLLGDVEYSIERSPRQFRPKKSGEGLTEQQPTAELIRHEPNGQQTPLASQPKKARDAVQELIGFNVKQFRQVVVLPQGEFRKFLATNSGEREDILRQLFKTDRFLDAEKSLKIHAAALDQQLAEQGAGINAMLASVGVDDADALETSAIELDVANTELEQKVSLHHTALELAREALSDAKRANEKVDALDHAKARLVAIDSTADEFKTWQHELDLANRAARLEAPFLALEAGNKRHADLIEQQRVATEELKHKSERYETAAQELEKATQSQATIDQLATRIAQLEQTRDSVSGLDKTRAALEAARKADADSSSRAVDAKKTVTDTETALDAARKRIDELRADPQTSDAIKARGQELSKIVDDHKALATILTTLQQEHTTLGQTQQHREKLTAEKLAAIEKQKALTSAREMGHAVLLARDLVEGTPCLVCGSTTHPSPAENVIDIPDPEDIQQAAARVDKIDDQIKQCQSNLTRAATQIETANEREAELTRQLGEHRNAGLSQIEAERDALRKTYQAAVERETEIDSLATKLDELNKTLVDHRLAAEQANADARERAVELGQANTALESLLSQLPDELRTAGALESALSDASKHRATLEQTLSTARKRADAAQNEKTAGEAELKTITAACETALTDRDAVKTAWIAARSEAAFKNDEQYSSASLSAQDLDLLDKRVSDYRRDLDEAQGALKAAQENAAGVERIDIATLVAREIETKALHETSNGQLFKDKARAEQLRKTLSQVRALTGSLDTLRKDCEAARHVANVADGNNPQRLSLHRYVLSVILDEVLEAASHRLRALSSGRYRLQRRVTPGHQGKAGGLELDVHDENTGHARAVATLSGGEGFQAALSLALGLAEVTQNRAGGIHLDTLFIDEGFGNLDPEALDAAINTLTGLNDGKRLIGIISHVPELKERIDTRLVIKADDGGSTTRWELA